jgi:hypothetical protein
LAKNNVYFRRFCVAGKNMDAFRWEVVSAAIDHNFRWFFLAVKNNSGQGSHTSPFQFYTNFKLKNHAYTMIHNNNIIHSTLIHSTLIHTQMSSTKHEIHYLIHTKVSSIKVSGHIHPNLILNIQVSYIDIN